MNWINKKSGPPSTELTNPSALETEIGKGKVTVVFFGDASSDDFKAFEKAASRDDKRTFFHTADAESATAHDVKAPGVALFRPFDEPVVHFEGKTTDDAKITEFIEAQSVPTLIEFSDEFIEPIFQKQNAAIFLFRDAESADHKALQETFNKAAVENKGKILFSVSGATEGIQQRVAEYVGVKADDMPAILLIDFSPAGIDKYKFTEDSSDFTVEQVSNFVGQWKAGKLTKFLKSQEVPATNDEPVKVVVGKNFNEIVRDSDDDVLLEFYAPWCGHCKQLEPKYNELAEELKDVEGLVIAKVDATENEIEGVQVQGFPTIKFFAKGSKRAPQDFSGDREVDGFKTWLKDNSAAYKAYLDKQEDL